jgi:hypothetical protein
VWSMAIAAAVSPAYAAHPLISEDTGTQGKGRFELELGTSWTRAQDGNAFELDPQLSYGVRDDIDLILRPSLFRLSGSAADQAGRHGGFGTTALDVKWRIAGRGAIAFGTRAGVDLPTAQRDLGPQGTGWHALAMVTYDDQTTLATANIGYTRLPTEAGVEAMRRNLVRVSAALAHSVREDVRLLVDVAAYRTSDPSVASWPAVAVVGAIFRTPAGFDVDVGWQGRLNHAAPASVWLAGLTLRW